SSTSLVRAELATARRGGTLNRERAPLIVAPRAGAVSPRTSLAAAVSMYDPGGGDGPPRRLAGALPRKAAAARTSGRLFDYAGETHVRNLTAYLVEVFGHGSAFTDEIGGFEHVKKMHADLRIRDEQRDRFVELMLEAADEVGLPGDD